MAAADGTAAAGIAAAAPRRPTANPVHSNGEPTGTAGDPSAGGSPGIAADALTISVTGAARAAGAESVRSAGSAAGEATDARAAVRDRLVNAARGPDGVAAVDDGGVVPFCWAADRGVVPFCWAADRAVVPPTTLAGVALRRGAAAGVPESASAPAEVVSGPAAGVSAQATADALKAAAPTPRATAKPPTRPTRLLVPPVPPLC